MSSYTKKHTLKSMEEYAHPLVTPDGSYTAHNARYGETYGSRHGAVTQAQHIFVQGTDTHLHPNPHVLEVGFGLGLNFRTTLQNATERGVRLHYWAYEFDPVPAQLLRKVSDTTADGWDEILKSWDKAAHQKTPLIIERPELSFCLYWEDISRAQLPSHWASAIYLDGFSPQKNPEVWTPTFVENLAGALRSGGVLATYSAAGHVRRSLASAGLIPQKIQGAVGKRESLRAVKP